jgi:hypothetical protein
MCPTFLRVDAFEHTFLHTFSTVVSVSVGLESFKIIIIIDKDFLDLIVGTLKGRAERCMRPTFDLFRIPSHVSASFNL